LAKARSLPEAAIVFALLLLSALPYLGALRYGFVYDDEAQIVSNEAIQRWSFVPAYFTGHVWSYQDPTVAGNYFRPLFLLWLRLNHAAFGLHPFGWHLTTLLVHLGVVALVYALLRGLFGSAWLAAAGALLFAVHPARAESVVWISGVTDPLAALGMLGSCLFWLRSRRERSAPYLLAALLAYAAAMLCKETAVVLPVILFGYAWLEDTASGAQGAALALQAGARSAWQTAPFWLVAVAYLFARFAALHGLSHPVQLIPFSASLLMAPYLFCFYLGKLLWPWSLSLFYGLGIVSRLRDPRWWLSALILTATTALLVFAWRRSRERALPQAALWIAVPLLPVLNAALLPADDFAHNRYLYLPSIGFAIFCALLLQTLARSMGGTSSSVTRLAGATLLLAGAFGVSTALQATPWRSDLSLYGQAVEHSPGNSMALNNLATAYMQVGRLVEAHAILADLILQRPNFWLATYNFGYLNYRMKRLSLAESYLRRAIALNPLDADEYAYLGLTYLRQGRPGEASAQLRQAIARKPSGPGYHIALGMVLLQLGDRNAAKAAFLEELRYHPDSQPARQQLALVEQALASAPSSPPR